MFVLSTVAVFYYIYWSYARGKVNNAHKVTKRQRKVMRQQLSNANNSELGCFRCSNSSATFDYMNFNSCAISY